MHPGAVYLHQGESYIVDSLDFEDGVAFVHAEDPGYTTFARELTDIVVTGPGERKTYGPVTIGLVPVSVTNTVIGYLRRRLDGEVIDFVELDMPTRTLDTTAVMCTITPEALQHNGIDPLRVPGALHAAEHAAIGLLPLVASCDRGDIGGVSTAVGPVDGLADDFVYDGYPGGAGFADRGFRKIDTWWAATAAAIEACECPLGCPSCVQSPKCGSGNDPLDKRGRCGCCVWCSASSASTCREPPWWRPTPRRPPHRSAAMAVRWIGHAEHTDRCGKRSDNAIRSPIPETGRKEESTLSEGYPQLEGRITDPAQGR